MESTLIYRLGLRSDLHSLSQWDECTKKSVVLSNLPQTFKPGRLLHIYKWQCLTWRIRFPESEAYLFSGKGTSIMERRACSSGISAGCVGWTRCPPPRPISSADILGRNLSVRLRGEVIMTQWSLRGLWISRRVRSWGLPLSYSLPPFSLHTS